ncbi:hypothetical protein [Prochlorococcus marinus]|uniref:Uncharacterized protein n=1 Tax=Prochlorococcus marinus XMU1408 TaxID=2213228 RepID=A0A318R8W8_PROMR|nr:hypothetical protein [Prochlorococcus marinus]MBW3041374.1 hypothetical protein [Prochlorococcus marinus str. XMU1408]PYE02539.1 hypothetical protein DNJ73_01900 [Prochlorococcus marinus XMU1408]
MNLEASNGNLYNNADSFAMAFDAAWKDCSLQNEKDLNIEERIQRTFEKIKTHPFLIENPIQSRNIALFRIKLLGLS